MPPSEGGGAGSIPAEGTFAILENEHAPITMNTARPRHHKIHLIRDLIVIALSIFFGIWFAQSGLLEELLLKPRGIKLLEIFIAGSLFTSAFTTVPAMIALGGMAQVEPLLLVAFVGAIGAVVGDYIIFRFVRDSVAEDLEHLVRLAHADRFLHVFKRRLFRFFVPLLGALVIASPLPDELGIALLGFSRAKISLVIPISFCFNFLGILVVGLVARGAF